MTVKTGTAWAGTFVCLDATGALEAGTPAGVLYVDGVANGATVTISGSNPYKFAVTLPSLTAGQRVDMYITATIDAIATASVVASEQADTALVSEVKTDTAAILLDTGTDGVVLKAAGLAEDAVNEIVDQVWNEAIADHTATTTFGGKNQKVVPSETINDYKADVSGLATSSALTAVDDLVDDLETRLTAVRAGYLDKLNVSGTLAHSNDADTYKADVSAITGASLSATGIDAILDEIVVGTYTMRQILKLMAAKMHGKATGGGTTSIKYTGLDNVADVIIETVDTNGNRSAVSLTV